MRTLRISFFLSVALIATGCGNTPNANIAGTYQGTQSGNEGATSISEPVTVTMSEDSMGNVSGSWSGNTVSGTFTGTANGNVISPLNLNIASGSCSGTLSGSASVQNVSLTGNLSGTANCGQIAINFSLVDQAIQSPTGS